MCEWQMFRSFQSFFTFITQALLSAIIRFNLLYFLLILSIYSCELVEAVPSFDVFSVCRERCIRKSCTGCCELNSCHLAFLSERSYAFGKSFRSFKRLLDCLRSIFSAACVDVRQCMRPLAGARVWH
jgi:hypothetical protein